MAQRLAVTPFLTGDPLRLEGVTSLSGLLAALGLGAAEQATLLALGPRVALVFRGLDGVGPVSLRWVNLPAAQALDTTGGPADVAIVLMAGLRDSGTALGLAGRLRAGLRNTALFQRAAAAATREELVAVLGALDESPSESPLSGDEVLGLLGSGRAGLAAAEAARDRKSTRLNSSHIQKSRMPSSA